MKHNELRQLVNGLTPDELFELRRLIEVRRFELTGPPRREQQAPERVTVIGGVGRA